MAELSLDNDKTAVMIADFYADEMSTVPHATERKCVQKARALQQAARDAGLLVVYSATVHREGYPEISPRNKTFGPRKTSGEPAVSDPVIRIHSDVAPRPGEPVIGKHRVDAFFQTDLDMILRANGIQTLVLLGFASSGVILSGVRYASDADYELVVAEDCCADREPDVHAFLMDRIFPRQATVTSSAEIIKAIVRK